MNKLFASLLLGVMFLTGCQYLSPIGPIISIGVMWLNGEGQKYYNASQDVVFEAVKKTAADMDFVIVDVEHTDKTIIVKIDDKSASLEQKASGANRFNIRITKVQHNVTKLAIRLNFWGDKPYADLFFEKVDKYPGVKSFETTQELNTAVEGK